MADQIQTDGEGRVYKNGVLQAHSAGSSGVGGAISDAVAALAKAFAPKGITDRGKRVAGAIAEGEGDSNTLGNQF